MEVLDVNQHLASGNLFVLFKAQLKKDFEGAGLDGGFTDQLPVAFELLKKCIGAQITPLMAVNVSRLSGLLYRVDISEVQIKRHQQADESLSFEEGLSELIIKRVLQKVILKKKFSDGYGA